MENIIILKNFNSLCRLCLVSGVELISIYGDSNFGLRYGDEPLSVKIAACTSLEICENDELPNFICKTCSMKIVRAFEFRQQAKRSDEILRRYVQDKEYKKKQESAEKQLQQVLFNNKNGNSSNQQVIAEELEVEPLTYCVKVEPDEDEDENSNFMGSEDCSDEGNAEQNIIADVDPPTTGMEDDDSDEEQLQNQPMIGQEFEPAWMNNGNEDNENGDNSSQWICQYCNSTFPNEEKFNRHALIHTSEPPFPCDYCEESFELRTDLKAHWRVHSDGNPHVCQMCGKSFPDRMSYLKHSDLHDQVKPFRCPVCQKSFCYGSDLRKHAITHTGVRPYVCSVCGNSFTRSTSLNKHLRMHNGNRPFSCSACPKIFGSRGDLKRHQIIHSGIKPWICTVCSVPFNRKDKLVRHEKLHSGEPRPFQCYECPTSFSRKEDLTKHIQFHHYKPPPNMETSRSNNTEEETIENNTLDQISKSDLERGNRTFRALIREAFSGSQTNGWNAALPTINIPNVESKQENNLFKCDICHKKFSQKHSLDSHKKIHTAVKPYGCSMCEKSFYRRRELTRHEAVHTGYKPFSCGVCGKCFSRTDKLNRHVQTHQYKSIFRNHKCEACSLNFRTEQELQKHKPLCKPESKETNDEFYPEVIVKSEENDVPLESKPIPVDLQYCKTPKKNREIDSRDTLTKLNKNPEILLLPIV